jgi:peptide/nickel transport system substrate-binding protein
MTNSHPQFLSTAQVHAGLLQYDFDFNPHPWLAESWEVSPDGLTYTFHLVQNATFHDGEPVTSADVKFTMEEITIPYNPMAAKWTGPIEEIETPDDYTVVFKLSETSGVFLLGFAPRFFYVMPKHIYEGTDIPNNPINEAPIGCGPFKFEEFVRGDHITLVKNENYFRKGLPYLDKIVTRFISDESQAALMLEEGELDHITAYVEKKDVNRLVWNEDIAVSDNEYLAVTVVNHLDFNLMEGHYTSDINVRRAIAHAIDRQELIDKVEYGQADWCENPSGFAPSIPWFYKAETEYTYEFNVTKANEILDNAGYEKNQDGWRFGGEALLGTTGTASNYAQDGFYIIKERLKDIGIKVDLEWTTPEQRREKTHEGGEFDMFQNYWTTGPDPVISMDRWYTTAEWGKYWRNICRYNNSEVDNLAALAAQEPDWDQRAEYYYEIQEILARDLPVLALYDPKSISATDKNFIGLPAGPLGGCNPKDRVWYALAGEAEAEGFMVPVEYLYIAAGVAVIAIVVGVYGYMRRK